MIETKQLYMMPPTELEIWICYLSWTTKIYKTLLKKNHCPKNELTETLYIK